MKLTKHFRRARFTTVLILLLSLAACGTVPSVPEPSPTVTETVVSEPAQAPTLAPITEVPVDTPVATQVPVAPQETAAATTTVAETAAPEQATPDATSTSASLPAGIRIRNGSQIIAVGSSQVINLQQGAEPISPSPATISPDGSYVVYSENAPGRNGISILNLGTGQTEFIPDATWAGQFSPDSRSLAYAMAGMNGSQLFVRDLQTGETRTVQQGGQQDTLRPIAWTDAGIFAERIIMFSDAPPQGIYLVDPAGSDVQPVHEQSYIQAAIDSRGSKAALVTGFLGMGTPSMAGLSVLDLAAGSQQEVVGQSQGVITHVLWSPDASQLFYAATTDFGVPARTFQVIDAVGSDGRTIALDELGLTGALQDAAWRDQSTLLLLVGDAGAELRLYELSLDNAGAGVAHEVGTYGPLVQGQTAQILLSR
jgi:hypothetical protein